MGSLNIADEMAITSTRNMLILPRNIPQAIVGENKNAIRRTYTSGKQYLSFPDAKEGRWYLDTFARNRAGAGSFGTIGRVSLLLINCIIKGQKLKIERVTDFLTGLKFDVAFNGIFISL